MNSVKMDKILAQCLLVTSIVAATSGMTYYNTINAGSQMNIGNHQISVVSEPFQKLFVDGKQVNLSTAGIKQTGEGFTVYSDFPNLPGLSVRFFDNGGYTVFYENGGVVSKIGSLSPEEERELNERLAQTMENVNAQVAQTMENVNAQVAQVQQQVGNMMQSLTNTFNQPGWPFVR